MFIFWIIIGVVLGCILMNILQEILSSYSIRIKYWVPRVFILVIFILDMLIFGSSLSN